MGCARRYSLAAEKQKAEDDQRRRKNLEKSNVAELFLQSTAEIQEKAITNLDSNKLAPRYIVPFKIAKVHDNTYGLNLLHPCGYILHPTQAALRFIVHHFRRK